MKKPKYKQKINIDSWICCWCGKDNSKHNKDLNFYDGTDIVTCEYCGKENELSYSIEYLSTPVKDEE